MIKKFNHLYVNESFKKYEPNFINLARIKEDKIDFDYKTRFLDEDTKNNLNSTKLSKYENSVVISKINDKWFFVCDLKNESYTNGKVKVHELTLPDTIQGMASNLHYYNAEASPVVLIYEKEIDFETIVSKKFHHEHYQNDEMESWIYVGKYADELTDLFNENSELYIADGHHRIFTSSISQTKDSIMAALIHSSCVEIESIPRIIENVSENKFQEALAFLESRNMITECEKFEKGVVKLTRNKECYYIKLVDLQGDFFWNNDVYRFNTQVLSQAFGIFDSSQVVYHEDQENIEAATKTNSVIVDIYPMSIDEFIQASKTNSFLPPKSTLFSPKYPSFCLFKKYKEI